MDAQDVPAHRRAEANELSVFDATGQDPPKYLEDGQKVRAKQNDGQSQRRAFRQSSQTKQDDQGDCCPYQDREGAIERLLSKSSDEIVK